MDSLIEKASRLTDYADLKDFFLALKENGGNYDLQNVTLLSERLERPEQKLKCIHVAGTNGKGSTCAMLESIFRENGYRTGLYTSPHLIRLSERIQVDRVPITESRMLELTVEMAGKLGEIPESMWPSFFEWMTVMAFLHFVKEGVDIAIIETGMGGTKDATNILTPELSVITSISRDHEAMLGDTIEAIAEEKAGIIKPGRQVLIGKLPDEAEQVVCRRVNAVGSQLFKFDEDFPETNLEGAYQRHNAALALKASELLNEPFPVARQRALLALERVAWRARWESVSVNDGEHELILDCSHNEEAFESLEEQLKIMVELKGVSPLIVVGATSQARAESLLRTVVPYTDQLFLVEFNHERALTPETIREFLPKDFRGTVQEIRVDELFSYGRFRLEVKPGQAIVVTGSIYMTGEISDLLTSPKPFREYCLQD